MDLRTYLEDEVAWVWIYGVAENEAVNMEHAATIRLVELDDRVHVVASMVNEEEVLLESHNSMSDARDWLKGLMVSMNGGNRR